MKGSPNQALQATPVSAGLEVLSRRPGVPELDLKSRRRRVLHSGAQTT